ncbi:ribonuclease P [Halobacteriales archaeon QS_4_69_34]|nr:MAG: ribonuclease P [Halobacteriales archaeon QS_4_69_34]
MAPYEAVRAHPDGESTLARLALTASEYGFEGLVVRNADRASGASVERVREEYGIDAVDAVEISAGEPSAASGRVGNHRSDHTVVIVRGGTPALNRFACEEPRVDVLARPMAGEGDVDHVLARAAARNGVRFEFDLGPTLRSSGGRRVRALAGLRKLRELVADADAPFVVSAGAESHLELRAPQELRAVGGAIGFSGAVIERGLAEWGRLAARNRERRSERFIEPGVRRGRYEEDDR